MDSTATGRPCVCIGLLTRWNGMFCLRHGIPVWQHIGQNSTATVRHRRAMTSDVSKRRYTQTNKRTYSCRQRCWPSFAYDQTQHADEHQTPEVERI